MATRSALRARRLAPADVPRIARLLDRDPVGNVYLRSELRAGVRGAAWWGVDDGDDLRAVALGGSLTVPCACDPADAASLADALGWGNARILVGPREPTIALQRALGGHPRELRDHQPLLALHRSASLPAVDVPVRLGSPRDIDALVSAAAAMHQEEMGVDPMGVDPSWWRARMASLVDRGWSWVWTERGDVVFKAELSALTDDVAQLQGVFTAPGYRRRGVATAGITAICRELFRLVSVCSLYANAGNEPALGLYRRLGFEACGEYATVIY